MAFDIVELEALAIGLRVEVVGVFFMEVVETMAGVATFEVVVTTSLEEVATVFMEDTGTDLMDDLTTTVPVGAAGLTVTSELAIAIGLEDTGSTAAFDDAKATLEDMPAGFTEDLMTVRSTDVTVLATFVVPVETLMRDFEGVQAA
jgi:hypothetical protein